MKTYTITTHEQHVCRYIVDANSPEEAMEKFKKGYADEAGPDEFVDYISIEDPVEINDEDDY